MNGSCASCGEAMGVDDQYCGVCGAAAGAAERLGANTSDPFSVAPEESRPSAGPTAPPLAPVVPLPPVPPAPPAMGVHLSENPAGPPIAPTDGHLVPFEARSREHGEQPKQSNMAVAVTLIASLAAIAALAVAVTALRQNSDGAEARGAESPVPGDRAEDTSSTAGTTVGTSLAVTASTPDTTVVVVTTAPDTVPITVAETTPATVAPEPSPPLPNFPVGVEDSGSGLICSVMADGRTPGLLSSTEQAALAAVSNLATALGSRDYQRASELLGGSASESNLADGYKNFDGTSLLFTQFSASDGTMVDFVSFAIENGRSRTSIYRIRWRVLPDGTIRYARSPAGPTYEAVGGAWTNIELLTANPAIVMDTCG